MTPVKTCFKTILRSFVGNAAKLISLTVIMFLGVAFVSGLGTLSPTVEGSLENYLAASDVPDLTVKAGSADGIPEEQLEAIAGQEYVSDVLPLTVMDVQGEKNTRIYVLDDFLSGVNTLGIEGRLPAAYGEVLAERHSDYTEQFSVGDEVTVLGMQCKVVGIASNPLIFDRLGEPDVIENEPLENIFYLSSAYMPVRMPYTDAYVRVEGLGGDYFSQGYKDAAVERAEELSAVLGDGFTVLTLAQNKSMITAESYLDKVTVIVWAFPAFFILVAALVVMTTMSRMIEEERGQIGCLKSLGMGNGRVLFKYMFMAAACWLVASALSVAVGLPLLPAVIVPAFDTIFFMPAVTGGLHPLMGIVSALAIAVAVLAVTYLVCRGKLKERPASLLVAGAPRPGKRIFLERVGFIWNRLPFRYKSSLRNIFRYKKHLAMTVVSVAGATVLAFAGLGLFNVAGSVTSGSFAGMGDSLKPISLVIIAFAMLLCVFVIYNLTNMNIGERKREIATLAVLGYRRGEILGYIYREIMMMAVFGVLAGIGLGALFLWAVLGYLGFGSLADVKWYTYFLAFGIMMLFTGVTDLILSPKILGIDMTGSLKAND